jgi:hypothetical protein
MAKNKSKKPASVPASPTPSLTTQSEWDFDSLEEKIRGEEILLEHEGKLAKEDQEVKKKLNDTEIDRRLKALREKIKPSKK